MMGAWQLGDRVGWLMVGGRCLGAKTWNIMWWCASFAGLDGRAIEGRACRSVCEHIPLVLSVQSYCLLSYCSIPLLPRVAHDCSSRPRRSRTYLQHHLCVQHLDLPYAYNSIFFPQSWYLLCHFGSVHHI